MKRRKKTSPTASAGRRAGYRQARNLALTAAFFLAVLLILQGCSAAVTESREDAGSKPEVREEIQGGVEESAGTQEEGKSQPQSQEMPAFDPNKPRVIRRGNPDRKMVTLTIDDGWNKDDRILDLLESYGIKCTVFPIGGRGVAEANPDWIRRMDRDGFEVCTHTYSHYKLTDHPQEWIAADIRKGQDVIAAVTGKRYPYMRPPGGFLNEAVERAAAENGCYVVMWSNEFGDTNPNITADGEVSAVLSRLSNGDIILCHFGGYHTYDALKRLIPEIQNRGYRFVTLTELLTP